MNKLRENLIQLILALVFLALVLFGLSFLPQALTHSLRESKDASNPILVDESLEGVVYGFSIGTFYKAYPALTLQKENVIYDTILGEPVVVGRSENGEVLMSHAETGEIFKPIKIQLEAWKASHPDTLIYTEN